MPDMESPSLSDSSALIPAPREPGETPEIVDPEVLADELSLDSFAPPTVPETDLRDTGALGFESGRELADLLGPLDALKQEAEQRVKDSLQRRTDVIQSRIKANNEKLADHKTRLAAAEKAEQERLDPYQTVLEELDASVATAIGLRMKATDKLARYVRDQNSKPDPSTLIALAPAMPDEPPKLKPIPRLEDDASELPANSSDVQIATLWRRILRTRAEYEQIKRFTTGLQDHGLSQPMSRFLLWSGYTVLGGAGGAIGNLLQESEIGNHMIERFFGALQVRLGFMSQGAPKSIWPADWGPIAGFAFSLVLVLALVAVVMGFLKFIDWATKAWDLGTEGDDSDSGDRSEPVTGESEIMSRRFLKAVLEGQQSIIAVLPGVTVGMIGLCVFLLFAPSFEQDASGSAFSISRTSIGFVIAVAVAAIAQVLFRLTVFPEVRRRLLDGESLNLLTGRSWAWYIVAIFVFTALFAFSPAAEKSLLVLPKQVPAAVGGAPAADATKTAPALSPDTKPRWGGHLVWFLASGGLLAACAILAAGSCFAGCYREESRTRARLFKMEERLARKLPDPPKRNPAPVLVESVTPREFIPDVPAVTYGSGWIDRDANDELITRCFQSGVLEETELDDLVNQHTECVRLLRQAGHQRAALVEIRNRIGEIQSQIASRLESTRNYENRLLRLQQQADNILLALLARYQDHKQQITEGFYVAQRAYGLPKAMSAAGGQS